MSAEVVAKSFCSFLRPVFPRHESNMLGGTVAESKTFTACFVGLLFNGSIYDRPTITDVFNMFNSCWLEQIPKTSRTGSDLQILVQPSGHGHGNHALTVLRGFQSFGNLCGPLLALE